MILSWQMLLSVGIGGFLGSISRFYLNSYFIRLFNSDFPYGILIVNVLGSFLIGIAFAIFMNFNIHTNTKLFITAGFLGGFTTYSTFAMESFLLLQSSFFLGLSNMLLNLLGSVIAAALGYKLFLLLLSSFLFKQ